MRYGPRQPLNRGSNKLVPTRYGSQGTPWLRMQFSGSCDRCVLVGRHTHMPASHYPLQRAGVDVVHPDFPILSRYRDEVPIHAHVFDALAPSATNSSFESASLRIKHMHLLALDFGSEHLVLLC